MSARRPYHAARRTPGRGPPGRCVYAGDRPAQGTVASSSRTSSARRAVKGHEDLPGDAHEFDGVWAHPAERVERSGRGSLVPHQLAAVLGAPAGVFGHAVLSDALPSVDYDPHAYELLPVTPTAPLAEGDVIELGDLRFQVMHLPGHTPGSIGLYEPDLRLLVSGDVVYDDGGSEMIDFLDESFPEDYRDPMRRLLDLDVYLVVPGHGECFRQARLIEVAEHYLRGLETATSRAAE